MSRGRPLKPIEPPLHRPPVSGAHEAGSAFRRAGSNIVGGGYRGPAGGLGIGPTGVAEMPKGNIPGNLYGLDNRPLVDRIEDKLGQGKLQSWRKGLDNPQSDKNYSRWKKILPLDGPKTPEKGAAEEQLRQLPKLDKVTSKQLHKNARVFRIVKGAQQRFNNGRIASEIRRDYDSVKPDVGQYLEDHRLKSVKVQTSQLGAKLQKHGTTVGAAINKSLSDLFLSGRAINPHMKLAVLGPAPASQSSEDVYELILVTCAEDGIDVTAEDLTKSRPYLDVIVQGAAAWCMATEEAFWINYPPQVVTQSSDSEGEGDGDLTRKALAFQISVIDEYQRMAAPVQYLNPTDPPWIWQLPGEKEELIRQIVETYVEKGHAAVYDFMATYRYRGEHVLPRFVACDVLIDALTLIWESLISQDIATGTASSLPLVVSPPENDFPTFDAQPIVAATAIAIETLTATSDDKDAKFLKAGTSTSDSEGEMLIILNAAMSAVAVLAFLGGPPGIVVASGIILAQGLLPLGAGQKDTLNTLLEGIEQVRVENVIDAQLNKVKSFADWVMDQKDILEGTSVDLEAYKSRALDNLSDETGTHGDTLYNTVEDIEEKIAWDMPKARVAVLLSLTYLFVAYSLKCRTYASMAVAAKDAGDSKAFHSYAASFRAELKVMQRRLERRSARVKEVIEELKKWRRERVRWIGAQMKLFPTTYDLIVPGPGSISWIDEYTNVRRSVDYHPGGNLWYVATRFKWSNEEDITKQQREAFNAYKTELEEHIERTFRNDLKIVEKWAEISKDVMRLLTPGTPIFAPSVARYEPLPLPHPLLSGAKSVAYSYTIGTDEAGVSKPSPWTEWLPLQAVDGVLQAPVLTIRDSNYSSETIRTVYHRVMKEGQTAEEVEGNTSIAEVFRATGAVAWVDSQPQMPAVR